MKKSTVLVSLLVGMLGVGSGVYAEEGTPAQSGMQSNTAQVVIGEQSSGTINAYPNHWTPPGGNGGVKPVHANKSGANAQ